MLSAQDLHSRAVANYRNGRYATALRQLRMAWGRTSEPNLRARILSSQAYCFSEQGDADRGLALCQKACELPGVDEKTTALAIGQAGLIQMRRGDTNSALAHFTAALALLATLADDRETGGILLNRGNLHLAHRSLPEAAEDFEEALTRLARAGEWNGSAKARHNLGYVSSLLGDLPRALSLMAEAREQFEGLPISVVADMDRAEVLVYAGMPKEAAEVLRGAARGLGSRRLPVVRAELDLQRAKALVYVDPAQALVAARRAATRFTKHGSTNWALRAQAVAAQAIVETAWTGKPPIEDLDDLVVRLRTARLLDESATVAATAARALVKRGRIDEALIRLRRLRMPDSASPLTRLLGHQVRAEAALAAKNRAAALAAARRGVDLLRGWESRFTAPDLQRGLAMHGEGVVLVGLEAAAQSRRPDLMLEWSERARGVAAMVADPLPGLDMTTTRTLEDLRTLGPGASQQHDQLRTAVRDARWAHAEAVGVVDAQAQATLPVLQQALAGADTTMVAYLAARTGIHALVVDGASATTHQIGGDNLDPDFFAALQADLEMAAAVRGTPIAAVIQASLDEKLHLASRVLIEPIVDHLATHRVVLAVPGRLSGVPWTMLPGLARHSVTVPISATRWVAEVGRQISGARRTLVAGPGVPRAEEEVTAICGSGDARILLSSEATVAAVRQAANESDVLHLVGHGFHAAENPLFSRLELADGPWWGYDVARLASVPEVVVLSACDLGQGSVTWGDESLGMTRAWLHAGARAVIAAPALVNDDDATLLLPEVHWRIAAGISPADALAEAAAATGLVTPFVCYGTGW